MNDYSRSRPYYGYLEPGNSSALSRMQQQYWTTKQALFKKIGRKEDDCVVSSDAELDAKLELFNAIQESCSTLLRVLESYQDRILALSQEENALGRFLKECGKQDKTRAGKMMGATGKTMSYTAQQRLTLRVPLVRLYQEVETYQYRAIADTWTTVEKMEKSRTDYRGALMWMKDVSLQLDPDTYKQLEKFRKVQGHVRKTKMKFEKLKLDTLQKVDLLAASRCNMFSHVLAAYQNALLAFWEKTSSTMTSVANTFKGYQHYDFTVVKELQEPSRKLAEEMGNDDEKNSKEDGDKDRMTFFDSEYHDDENKKDSSSKDTKKKKRKERQKKGDASKNVIGSPDGEKKTPEGEKRDGSVDDVPLLNLDEPPESVQAQNQSVKNGKQDLLTHNPEISDLEKDDMTVLTEILNFDSNVSSDFLTPSASEGSFAQQWHSAFGDKPPSPQKCLSYNAAVPPKADDQTMQAQKAPPQFLPSQLLDLESEMSHLQLENNANLSGVLEPGRMPMMNPSLGAPLNRPPAPPPVSQPMMNPGHPVMHQVTHPVPPAGPPKLQGEKSEKEEKGDLTEWYSLFADLDPLANPDAIGKKCGEDC